MINNVNIAGKLARLSKIETATNGIEYTRFAIEVGNKKIGFNNIPCRAWKENARYIYDNSKIGDIVAITGWISVRNYEDKNGQNRTFTEIIAKNIQINGVNND